MAEPLADQVMRKIKQADELYHRLMLVVAPSGAGKTTALKEVRKRVVTCLKMTQPCVPRLRSWYVPDPNKAGDLEKLRERTLLRKFKEYHESKQKRLKVFRIEAIRAGFKKAWQERDYGTIIAVARKIPEKILQEDPKLLMWYDQAITRSGEVT